MPKKKTNRRKKNKITKNWFGVIVVIAIVIVVLLMLNFFIPLEKIEKTNQEQTQQIPTEIKTEYICKRNFECFLVNCKSTPSIVDCVNVTEQETYYKRCKAYWDVNPVQDFTKCACVQGICKALK